MIWLRTVRGTFRGVTLLCSRSTIAHHLLHGVIRREGTLQPGSGKGNRRGQVGGRERGRDNGRGTSMEHNSTATTTEQNG